MFGSELAGNPTTCNLSSSGVVEDCWTREVVQRRHDPRKNYLQASGFAELTPGLQNWSLSLRDVTKPPTILSPRPEFWLINREVGCVHLS